MPRTTSKHNLETKLHSRCLPCQLEPTGRITRGAAGVGTSKSHGPSSRRRQFSGGRDEDSLVLGHDGHLGDDVWSRCGFGAAPASGSSTKPVLTIALPSAPTSLDPSRGSGATNVQFQDPAYQGLLHAGGDGGQISPSLASSYQWLGTGNQRLKVVLRSGLQFSDGAPLNSDAVKVSAEHFASAGGQFAYVGQEVASIETPDPLTVIFDLKASDPTFPSGLAETSGLGMIISPQALTGGTNLGTTTDGAGPYELSQGQTVEGSTYTYLPNPHYYNTSGIKYSKIVIRVISRPEHGPCRTSVRPGPGGVW